MTGPLFFTLHLHRRRARLLLPFAAAILVGQLACTSDQSTEPTANIKAQPLVATHGPHPRAKLAPSSMRAASARAATSLALFKARPSFSAGIAASSTGPKVLILADTASSADTALAQSLADAGVQVTLRDNEPEYTWDGTNPSLNGFDVVIHLNGATYDFPLQAAGQAALTSFVENGGGFVTSQWDGYETQLDMSNLVLLGMGFDPNGPEHNCSGCMVTYERTSEGQGHPVLNGLPASFSIPADGHDAGPAAGSATVLMTVDSAGGGPAVLVRQLGAGRVVNFSFAADYPWDDMGETHDLATLKDQTVQRLYLNAVLWTGERPETPVSPQSIAFGPLSSKVYGDPSFSVSATASSDLPVSFTAVGDCQVAGSTVSITAAGSCTITAHQAGNESYAPAVDVSQAFAILRAPATITVGTEFTYDGTVKSANITTSPAGLSGVAVTYSQHGAQVFDPTNAGVYDVSAVLENPNYQAPTATGTLTIHPAAPELHWNPAPLGSGTPLGPSQFNATATDLAGVQLIGEFAYTPASGSFDPGPVSLKVVFKPSNKNYAEASKTVSITVSGAMKFGGFFAPVKNMPYINTVQAGRSVPLRFTVGAYRGRRVTQVDPSSVAVSCPASGPENNVRLTVSGNSGLRSLGFSYVYVWKTSKDWAGSCRKFVLTLADGSTHEALFRFTAAPKSNPARRIFGH
jgi:hypothetical protein